MTRSLITKATAMLTLTAGLALGGAHAASADSINFVNSNALLGPATGPVAATLDVSCNMVSHAITADMAISPEPGFTSQAVAYQVVVKDVTYATTSTYSYPWQGYFWAKSTSYTVGNITYVQQGNQVPSYSFYGTPGHRYFVSATVMWWSDSARAWQHPATVDDSTYAVYYPLYGQTYWGNFSMCWA